MVLPKDKYIRWILWKGVINKSARKFGFDRFETRTPHKSYCEACYRFRREFRTLPNIYDRTLRLFTVNYTAWKVSKCGVFLVTIFLYLARIQENTDQKKLRILTLFTQWVNIRIQSKCRKIRTRKNSILGQFSLLTIFIKVSIIDVWQIVKYVCVI